MEPVTVLVADDHPVYRDGLARAIADHPALELAGTAADGRRAMALIREIAPDVAVLDVRMPGLTGPDIVAEIAREQLGTRTLLLSAIADEHLIFDAVASGLDGYLLKDADRDAICSAIESIAAGRTVLAPEAQAALARGVRARESSRGPAISPREREVLRLTAEGMSAARIGEVLHLSPVTVKSHLHSLYEKLGVSERAAAVAVAMRLGLLE
ncbi:response regulator [Miltoncostaea marina]|uniref:response regulator n=1 Tax=Miltoncostaea marina TaxID=2843215 RepID=UPI001C3C3C05|nr:response regulator transcription factor [Miltoncostaea marina]